MQLILFHDLILEEPSMFMNDPDYVPSVFVFSNATSDKDKRSRYDPVSAITTMKFPGGLQYLLRLKHQMISLNKQPTMNYMLMILQGTVN